MKNIKNPLFLIAFATFLITSCSTNNTEPILSFITSENGFEKAHNLLMTDESDVNIFLQKLHKDYKSSIVDKKLHSTIEEGITLEIDFEITGSKITRLNYLFKFDNEDGNTSLETEIKENLSNLFKNNGISKRNPLIKYEISSSLDNPKSFVRISFIYDFFAHKADLSKKVENFINKYPPASEFILTYFEGKQIIPQDEIWVLREVHRCDFESNFTSTRSDLKAGEMFNCNPGTTSDNRDIYYDFILNNKCLHAKGALISDGPLKKYSSWDIRVSYDDPEVIAKYSIGKNILYPDMSICVTGPDMSSKRLKIEVYKIEAIKSASEYLDFINKFQFDKTSFDYVQFMSFNSLMFEE